jgi:tetratricopeptide (TPR) repeat protein
VLYRDGQLGAAAECLGQATQRDPNDGEGWHLLGMTRWERGEPREAQQALAKAVKAARPYPPARYFLAVLYLAADRADRAVKELAELVEARPDHWEARLLKAWVGARIDKQRRAALDEARALAAADPADPRASKVLVECLQKAGLDEPGAAERKAYRALLAEPGAKRRVEEFLAATRGRYLPTQRIGRFRP